MAKATKMATKKPTKVASTHITVVLDRSGSMASIAKDMQGGFDQFIADQKALPGKCAVTLLQFDSKHETVYENLPIAKVPPLSLIPRGGTALLDAIGRGIALTKAAKADKTIMVIITDGNENQSHECTRELIVKQIAELGVGKDAWAFVFLGANQDSIATARGLGIHASNALNYTASPAGIKGMSSRLHASTMAYRGGAVAADAMFAPAAPSKRARP